MLISEELFLLRFKENSKKIRLFYFKTYLAGAILMDLVANKFISIKDKNLIILSNEQQIEKHPILREAINRIKSKPDKSILYWVKKFKRKKLFKKHLIEELEKSKIIKPELKRWMIKRYSLVNPDSKKKVLKTMLRAYVFDKEPDENTKFLLSLQGQWFLKFLKQGGKRNHARELIYELTKEEPIGKVIHNLVYNWMKSNDPFDDLDYDFYD